jgi:DNA-binding XRE family transcriptional regulator
VEVDEAPAWTGQQSHVEIGRYMARVLRRLGQAVRLERASVRYTVEDLASMSGISTSTLSRFERGDRAPRFDQLV